MRTSRIGINLAGKESVSKPFRFYIYGNKNISIVDKEKEAELVDDWPNLCHLDIYKIPMNW